MLDPIRGLNTSQRHAFVASLAGWSLDAFDFFIFVFALKSIAGEFHTTLKAVSEGIFLTLAMRPVGALFFGWLAERYGRRPILMVNIVSYSVFELASAFAPTCARSSCCARCSIRDGRRMGRGRRPGARVAAREGSRHVLGILQEGYVLGYLLASALFAFGFQALGWRGMFIVGACPALLVLYIRSRVAESPAWLSGRRPKPAVMREGMAAIGAYLPTFLFMVVLMACFNAFSHGTQDLYPTFLQVQHGFSPRTTGTIAIVYNLGALCGGILFGTVSERLGRRRAIVVAALLALPMIPLWAYSTTPLMFAVGSFLMQFMVQGAWGVVPAHLNELSPPGARAILPGFAYQLGNLIMARMGPLQAGFAESHGNDYALALTWTVGLVGVLLALVVMLGGEKRSLEMQGAS